MVSVVEPELLPPPPPPLPPPLPPHAATPRARAVTRQPPAATERTRKFGPSSRNAIPKSADCRGAVRWHATCTRRGVLTVSEGRRAEPGARDASGAPVAGQVGRDHPQR